MKLILMRCDQKTTENILAFNIVPITVPKHTITASLLNGEGTDFEKESEWICLSSCEQNVVLYSANYEKRIKVFIDKGFQHSEHKAPEFIIYKYEDCK